MGGYRINRYYSKKQKSAPLTYFYVRVAAKARDQKARERERVREQGRLLHAHVQIVSGYIS